MDYTNYLLLVNVLFSAIAEVDHRLDKATASYVANSNLKEAIKNLRDRSLENAMPDRRHMKDPLRHCRSSDLQTGRTIHRAQARDAKNRGRRPWPL